MSGLSYHRRTTVYIDLTKLVAGLWLIAMWIGLLPMTLTAVTVVLFLSMCEFKVSS